MDRAFYGHFTLPLLNFLRFNVLQGGSAQFGAHPVHWYATQGLPAVLPAELLAGALVSVFTLRGARSRLHSRSPLFRLFLLALVLSVAVHSAIAHKEHRFMLPLVPLLAPLLAKCWVSRALSARWKLAVALVNGLVFIYCALLHQRAFEPLLGSLREQLDARPGEKGQITYLTPCYALPESAHLHPHGLNWTVNSLDCIVPLNASQ